MRKLARHVINPSRIRRHHVLLAAIGFGLLVHEANGALRWFGESKQQVARETEQRMLDEFSLWSFHECPDSAQALHASGDGIDPWGHPYKLICDQGRDRVTLAIVSLGPDDGDTHTDLASVRSFLP
jgi:hypothetical protein